MVTELKFEILNMQKVTFSISTLPPDDTFIILLYISHLLNIAQKGIIQNYETLSISKEVLGIE